MNYEDHDRMNASELGKSETSHNERRMTIMSSAHDRMKYCDAMNTVHAPDSLLGKVKNMNRQSKVKTFKVRKLVYVAAALVAAFVSSNAITYAATGTTWMGKVIVKIKGVEQEMDVEHTTYIEDGVEYDEVQIHIDEEETDSLSVEFTDEEQAAE